MKQAEPGSFAEGPGSPHHGTPAMTGAGGLAFATPAPSPRALKPNAPLIAAPAMIFVRFTAHYSLSQLSNRAKRELAEINALSGRPHVGMADGSGSPAVPSDELGGGGGI